MSLAFREMRPVQQTSLTMGRHEDLCQRKSPREHQIPEVQAGVVRKLVNKVGRVP